MYLVKWENYDQPTWEPSKNIPEFITNYFEQTGSSDIPAARIKHTKTVGGSKFHLLVWDDSAGGMTWDPESAFQVDNSEGTETYSCNTKKDKERFYYSFLNCYKNAH